MISLDHRFVYGLRKHLQVFIIVSALILISDVVFVYINYSSSKKALENSVARQGNELSTEFNITFELTENYMQQAALFVASDQDVQQLFLAGKKAVDAEGGGAGEEKAAIAREALHQEVEVLWDNLIEQYDLRQLHFHLGPGSVSFLRVHCPEKFGDTMHDIRYTIVDANTYQIPTSGFETGRVYSGIRGVRPIFAIDPENGQETHVGAVEVGVSFTKILDQLDYARDAGFAVLLTVEHMQETMWEDFLETRFATSPPIGDFAIEAVSRKDELRTILAADEGYAMLLSPGTKIVKLSDGKTYGVTSFDLRDYQGLKTPDQPRVGVVYIWQDISDEFAAFKKSVRNNIIYAFLAYLLFEILFFGALHLLTQRLQQIVNEQTETIHNMATYDQLTGLYNRHCLESRFEEEIARAERHQTPFAVAMFDLDHFKKLNDTYGHVRGDQVLREIGYLLLGRIRRDDAAFRFGGEELLLILSNTEQDNAEKLCEHLLKLISSNSFADLEPGAVTVSIGLAEWAPALKDCHLDLIRHADAALYDAKQSGRNRVCVASKVNLPDFC